MQKTGNILIADDEETFLLSTAALLRKEGYRCECAPDGLIAREKLRSDEYDVLISDIRMNGNFELELIKNVSSGPEFIPVIVVTAYPSVTTAIQSINLPVAAYLVKPVDFTALLEQVEMAVHNGRFCRSVQKIRRRLSDWDSNLEEIGKMQPLLHRTQSPSIISSFLFVAVQNMVEVLADLKSCVQSLPPENLDQATCLGHNCPSQLGTWKEAIKEAIDLLEKTKAAFKSKELRDLRVRLEKLIGGSA